MSKTIWITGDTHGNIKRFSTEFFPDGMNLDKSDVVEILGDFGMVWDYNSTSIEENFMLDWLDKKPWTTVATLGNHENYDRIEKLPVEEHFGAPVYVLRPSVFLLKSGYVYTINGYKIWNFNGASSQDISDGIIDSSTPNWHNEVRKLENSGKWQYRIKGVSWWSQEIEQDPKVYERGLKTLKDNNWAVDFIWTHCAPTQTENIMGFYNHDKLTDYLQKVKDKINFGCWYFGHYHKNIAPEVHMRCIYQEIIRIA